MKRYSKVEKLPAAIRAEIEEMRRSGHIIDDILAHLNGRGVRHITRSGLAEYTRKIDERYEQEISGVASVAMQSRHMATVLVERVGGNPNDNLIRANLQLLQNALFKATMAMVNHEPGTEGATNLRDLKQAGDVLRNLASTLKMDDERLAAAKREAKEEAKAEALEAAQKAVADASASGEKLDGMALIKKIREEIYGVFEP